MMPSVEITEEAKAVAVKTDPITAMLADPEAVAKLDVDKLDRLFDLRQRMLADDAKREFYTAFSDVQSRMKPVAKRGRNQHTRSIYARAEDVMAMLHPLMTDHGFSWSVSMDSGRDDMQRFVLTLRHSAGHVETHCMDAPIDDLGPKGTQVKTRLHGMASSFTYCERHLLMKVFGVQAVADDDGNAASGLGPSSERIKPGQVRDIESLLDEVCTTDASRQRFYGLLGCKSAAGIRASQYRWALQALETKRRAMR